MHIYTQQEEQLSNLLLTTVNFPDSHVERSFKLSSMFITLQRTTTRRSPQSDIAKIRIIMETAKKKAGKVQYQVTEARCDLRG